jgi:hypothetical protein
VIRDATHGTARACHREGKPCPVLPSSEPRRSEPPSASCCRPSPSTSAARPGRASTPGIDQGDYVAIGAVFSGIALHIRDLPPQIVSDALSAARRHLHGPAGQRDPRGNLPALSDGPGH